MVPTPPEPRAGAARKIDPAGPLRPARFAIVLVAICAPLLLGAFIEADWSWGFDHLRRAGLLWRIALLLLLALIWAPGGGRLIERAAAAIGRRLEKNRILTPVLLSLAGLAIFVAFPIATRMYGDSRYILDDHTAESFGVHLRKMLSLGVQTRGAAVFVLHDVVSLWTGLSYERTYMLISALCGGVFVLAHARLAAGLPSLDPWKRAAILWVGLIDGGNQLFFGHIENYTVPRLFACLFLMGLVRSLLDPDRPQRRSITLLWLLVACFLHMQYLALVPAAIFWIGRDISRSRPALERAIAPRAAAGLILASLAGIALLYIAAGSTCYDYIYSGGRPHPRQLFLPVTTACTGLPYLKYTLFSGAHLLDLFGSLFSISSPAILLVLALLTHRTRGDDRMVPLSLAIGFTAIHNFVLNPAIGFPFDFDLMCVLSPPLLYTAVFLLGRPEDDAPRRTPGLLLRGILILGTGTITLFGVNASASRAYGRVEDMGVWLHRTYFGGSHYRLSSNLSTVEDVKEQERERLRVCERLRPQTYGDDREAAFLWQRLADIRIDLQDYRGAMEAFRSAMAAEPSRWERKKPLGYLETEVGDRQRGLRLLSEYVLKAPGDAEAWLFLADGFAAAGLSEMARQSYEQFLKLAPDAPEAPRARGWIGRLPPG